MNQLVSNIGSVSLTNSIVVNTRVHILKSNFVRTWLFIVLFSFVANSVVINAKEVDGNFQNLKSCLVIGGIDEGNIIVKANGDVYNELNYQWNTWNGYIEPMAYLMAIKDSDIRTAVICCKSLNIHIVPRCGGHSFDKRSFGDSGSLIVDLAAINKISIDSVGMHYEVGAGARTGLISYTLWNEGEHMTSLGICPTVGIAGLALGGGYGFFTRIFGLVTDNLVELQMIDSNGNLQIINNSTNDDLFWALRGGGGGSFGIVTKFKFKMYKAPKSVTYGKYFYRIDDFQQFYGAYQSLLSSPSVPNKLGLLTKMDSHGIEMEVTVMHFENPDVMPVNVKELLESFSFPKAGKFSLKVLSYPDFIVKTAQPYVPVRLTQLSQLQDIDRHFPAGWLQSKSLFVKKILSKSEISELYALIKPFIPYSTMYFEHNGGAIDDRSRTETAFVHRNNLYSLQLDTFFNYFNYTAISAMNTFYDASKRLLNHQESYQNYVDPMMTDYLQRYYGENLQKLIQIKTKYDPDNVFNHVQSIPIANTSVSVLFMM